jgi:hypothetical protein
MFLSFMNHNAMKKHEAVKVQLHASPVSEVERGGRSSSDSGCLTSKERALLPPEPPTSTVQTGYKAGWAREPM